MGRGGRTNSKCSGNARVRVKNMESEGSDEDYVAEVDEVDDQSEELDSLVGDASEEESFFEAATKGEREGEEEEEEKDEVDEEEEEEVEEEEEEEEEEDGDDEEWRTVVKSRARKVKVSTRTRRVKGSTRTRKVKESATGKRSTKPRKNGVRRPKRRRRVRSDDEEDSDDDDEEFTPDEEYVEEEEDDEEEEEEYSFEEEEEEEEDEEEEFSLLKKSTKKRGRTKIKNTSVKSRKKRNAKPARRPRTKKHKKTRSLRTRSADDEEFLEKGPILRDRSRKKQAHGKNRVTAGSDSDFCSDSSDYEFTISEEEREQIREANQICGRLATNLRSSRRIQEDEAFCEPKLTPVRNVRKGKEKAEEKKNEVGKAVCGICLTEEGKNTIRGTLNCCSHYFCFACIFEWSKVETRCPLCKQRFVSISKPARCVRGFDLRDTVIAVPECDQVYQPSEEELRDFLNPYENVICTECHQGGDDALMLLCDLCDSPAHTYCVGLGHEVPEGNWYCDGCRPVALGPSHSQTQDLTLDQRTSTGMSDGTSSYENMAEIDLNVSIPETPVSQGNGIFPSPRFSSGSFQAPSPASGMGVSTVSGRRMIHEQIRRHILSNRFSQISPGADISALGNLSGRGINATQQHNRLTDVGPSHHTQYVDRLQENPFHSVQNRDSFPGRLGHMMRGLDQPSTSANGFAHSQGQWSELDGFNLGDGQSQVTVSEQLRSCTSRSNSGPEIGVSPVDQRYGEQTNFLKQQVHIMVRNQLKSLSRDTNLGEFISISYYLNHILR